MTTNDETRPETAPAAEPATTEAALAASTDAAPAATTEPAPTASADADELPPGYRRSGLRNPAGAVRGMGAAALGLQGLVLLLAIQPIRLLGGHLSAGAVWAVVVLSVVCFVLCGMLRRPWVWTAGTVVQGALLLGGFLHWSLFALGVIFGLVWVYILYVRRSILG